MNATGATGATKGRIPRWRRRLGKIAWRVGRVLLVTYLAVVILLAIFQTRLIFPGMATQGSADVAFNPPPGTELLQLTAKDGNRIAALFGKALPTAGGSVTKAAPTVIYFYGNAMCLKDALSEFRQFRRLGANVLAVEYEGFGLSGGEAGEQGCYAAAEAGYQYLLTRHDIDAHKFVPAGWSLGAAVAIDLARRHAGEGHIAGVMTFSAFTSMAEMAGHHYPGVPVSLLLKHHFYSEEKIAGIGVPILIGHGQKDDLVPFAMAGRVAAAAGKAGLKVTRLVVPTAEHNDFFVEGEAAVDQAAGAFLGGL
jgi:fermentation-respiration switch protein FrsA (DUF1100 family)